MTPNPAPEIDPDAYDRSAVVDGLGCTQASLDAYLTEMEAMDQPDLDAPDLMPGPDPYAELPAADMEAEAG